MSNLQKIIEENEKEFDKIKKDFIAFKKGEWWKSDEDYIKNLSHSSQLRLIEGFKEMVRKKPINEGEDYQVINSLGKSDIMAVLDIMSEGGYTREEAENELQRIQMKNIDHLIGEFKKSLLSELNEIK